MEFDFFFRLREDGMRFDIFKQRVSSIWSRMALLSTEAQKSSVSNDLFFSGHRAIQTDPHLLHNLLDSPDPNP